MTFNLADRLMQSAMKITGLKNKSETINQALSEFLNKRARENIKNAYGKLNSIWMLGNIETGS